MEKKLYKKNKRKLPLWGFWEEIDYLILEECTQLKQEGFLIDEATTNRILRARTEKDTSTLYKLRDDLKKLDFDPNFKFFEPSTLSEIRSCRPDGPRREPMDSAIDLYDRIYGGWLGRSAGCALGKPIEKWTKDAIHDYLEFYSALPLDDYIPIGQGFPDKHPEELHISATECTRGHIRRMSRDDDMDYPILGLITLERCGLDISSLDTAETWLHRIPAKSVYTAEHIAYRNLLNRIDPPCSGSYNNPYREFIGAQIRADIWGYVCPGWPEKAAELAFNDACVSATKNGIYGEMFVAAMISGSYLTHDPRVIIQIGLSEIPKNCRLSEAVSNVVTWSRTTDNWESTWQKVHDSYGHYNPVHVIPNAAMIVLGILKGDLNFQNTIVTTVLGGWDADCTGATAGSIAGVVNGAKSLPKKWVGVFNDRLESAVRGFQENKISELAQRTVAIAQLSLQS